MKNLHLRKIVLLTVVLFSSFILNAQVTWQLQSDYFGARDVVSQIRSMRGIALAKDGSASLFLGYIQGSSTSAVRRVKAAVHSTLGSDAIIIGNYVSGPPTTATYTGTVGSNPVYTGGSTGVLEANLTGSSRTFRNLATDDRGYVYTPDGAATLNPLVRIYNNTLATPVVGSFSMTASGNGRGIKVLKVGTNYYVYVAASSGIIERWNVTDPTLPTLDGTWGKTVVGANGNGRIDLKTVSGWTTAFALGLTVDLDGTLYVAGGFSAIGATSAVFKVSNNGDLQTASASGSVPFAYDVAVYYNKLYVVEYNADASRIAMLNKSDLSATGTIDPTTTFPRSIATLPAGENTDNGYSGIDVSSDGKLYIVDQIYKYFSNPATPAYTPPATSFNPTPVAMTGTRIYFDRVLVSSPVQPAYTNAVIASTSNVSCFGGNNGSASVSFTEGYPPYSYSVDAGSYISVAGSPFTVNGLTAGSHSVVVKDGGGNTSTASFSLTQPAAALALGTCAKGDALCDGSSSASVSAGAVTNAVGTVNYTWRNASNAIVGSTATVSSLPAGTYSLTVSDNCFTRTCSVSPIITQEAVPPVAVTQSATIYLDANGNATLSPAQVNNGSSDNCAIASMSVTPSSFTCNNVGNTSGVLNGQMTVDNQFTAYLSTSDNTLGTPIGSGNDWTATYTLSAATLTPGTNYYLHIKGTDVGGPQMLIGDFTVSGNFQFANGQQTLSTNTTDWHVNTTGFGNSYNTPVSYGANGVSPWANRPGISAGALNIWDPSGNSANGSLVEDAYFSTPITYNGSINTVTLTVTDYSNNSASAPATITVIDNLPPAITAPSDVTVNNWCQPVPVGSVPLGTPVTSDNCAVASVTNNAPATYPVGNTTVTWTATDIHGNSAIATQMVTVTAGTIAANAAVSPLYPMSGQEIQTIYLGYPSSQQTEDIVITPLGGTGPYTYNWQKSNCVGVSTTLSTGITTTPTNSTATFAPTMSDICSGNNDNIFIFTCVVNDSHGCPSVTLTKRINVVNPYVGADIQLCHRVALRGSTTTQLLVVPQSQVATHLAHGDYLGNCPVFIGREAAPVIAHEAEEQRVAVYPNPTTGVFVLELSEVREQANIIITDVASNLVSMKTLEVNDTPTATFDMSNLSKGMYLIQVRDGELNYRTKIVVQ